MRRRKESNENPLVNSARSAQKRSGFAPFLHWSLHYSCAAEQNPQAACQVSRRRTEKFAENPTMKNVISKDVISHANVKVRRALAMALFVLIAPVANAPTDSMFGVARFSTANAQNADAEGLRALRRSLADTWLHRSNGDRYVFRSNGTYTFSAGRAKRRAGNVSHSGTWRLSNYSGQAPEGIAATVTLGLRATRRTVLEGRRRKTLRANNRFTFPVEVTEADGVIAIGNDSFYTMNSPERPASAR